MIRDAPSRAACVCMLPSGGMTTGDLGMYVPQEPNGVEGGFTAGTAEVSTSVCLCWRGTCDAMAHLAVRLVPAI